MRDRKLKYALGIFLFFSFFLLIPEIASARRVRDFTEDVIILHLSKNQADEMIEHSKREFPIEACGILAGKDGKVERVYPMTNTKKSSKKFLMDPEEQFKVLGEISKLGLQIIGIYHSHIDSEGYPSPDDVDMAYYPDAAYVIISLKDIGNPVVRVFKIVDGKITEGKIFWED